MQSLLLEEVNKAILILKFTMLNVKWQDDYESITQDGKSAADFDVGSPEKAHKPFFRIADRN
jgi:hypothetical protein